MGKPGLWRSQQCFHRSAFSKCLHSLNIFKSRRMEEKCLLHIVIIIWQKVQKARRPIKACSFCPSISRLFPDDVRIVELLLFVRPLYLSKYINTVIHSNTIRSTVPAKNPIKKKTEKKMLSRAESHAVTRIRTWVVAATTRSTNHYTITAITTELAANLQSFTIKLNIENYF